MSYRINWYSVDKFTNIDWENTRKHTMDEYEGVKVIYHDIATDLIEEVYNDEEFIPLREEKYNDGDINSFILSKEGLKYIIEKAIILVERLLESGLKDKGDKEYNVFSSPDYLIKRDLEDLRFGLYNLNDDKDDYNITTSWQWRFGIFNLIYLYKAFDWENNQIVLIGS
jgi:hypothetical protein